WCPACVVRRSFCACGCGEKIKYRYARYRAGHYMLGRHLVFTDLHKKRISLGARRRFKNKKAHEQMSFSMRKYFATHPVESQRMAKAHVVWQGLNRSEWRLRALLVRYGFRFSVQKQLGLLPYVPDFVLRDVPVVVECDGYWHTTRKGILHDQKRDAALRGIGYTVLRFSVKTIYSDVPSIIRRLNFYVHEAALDLVTEAA